ncbi:hypothetical protein FRB91_002235 [Serendipita sp. 411]|nr:hypothetical protein FRB91_002235 [Serendipita sp. 411]
MPPPRKRARKVSTSPEEGSEYASSSESEVESLNSEALDDETPPPASQNSRAGKNSRSHTSRGKNADKREKKGAKSSISKVSPSKKEASSTKKRKRGASSEEEDNSDTEVIGKIVQAPTTGRVPPGQISQNTLDFLQKLKDPEYNDREWFKLHEPVYRQAEKEWNDFVDAFTTTLTEVDDEIPHLPPKDVIHRIYRDVRFSNDKTPYKSNFSASFSRTGRKGTFSHYHVSISPNGGSFFAAGVWCPGKNELDQIRSHLKRNAAPLRALISDPTFESLFGPAKWSQGRRQNIFGRDDQLKVAPKGVAKDHPDIDLLKCRSYAVAHKLTDEQVLAADFKELLGVIAETAKPFVRRLNLMMTLGPDEDTEEEAES